ncbi:hypothetical protein FHT78_001734 [Rhizobium sp. BK196]|nr:hypothetical protein [Rhizobium sp. BK196]MBB3309991.1 hypothetical protein [Rhizobium sp. BK196]
MSFIVRNIALVIAASLAVPLSMGGMAEAADANCFDDGDPGAVTPGERL